MLETDERIKHRVISLEHLTGTTRDAALKLLSVKEGMLAVEPVKHGIRVKYSLRQTSFCELLSELHSQNITIKPNRLGRLRLAWIRLVEQHERDNLLSQSGWKQRVLAIHVACQSRNTNRPVPIHDHQLW